MENTTSTTPPIDSVRLKGSIVIVPAEMEPPVNDEGSSLRSTRVLCLSRCRRYRISQRRRVLIRTRGPFQVAKVTAATKRWFSLAPPVPSQQAPTVVDKNTADAVEDAIELYVTDMAHRRHLVADEETTDFEEARMFKHGEEISHGHFRKWRKAIEGKYKEEGIGLPFWCEHLGEAALSKAKWNAALRQSQ